MMWWVEIEKLESTNKVILFQNDLPVRNENDVLIFIVAVSAVEDATGRIKVSFDDGSSLQLSLDDFRPKSTSLKADMKASDFAKQFAKEFAGQLPEASETNSQLPEASETNSQLPEELKSGYGKRHIAAGLIGGVCAVVAAPVVLGAVGFTSAGIAGGSYAASMMSAAAIANGGGVAAGSAVAVLQSVGAAGLGTAGAAAVGSAGAAVGAAVSGLAGAFQNYFKGKAPQTETSTDNDDD